MEVITLHKCQRCGKIWFPRTFWKPKLCPTCKNTEAEPRPKILLSSVGDYMGRMRQELAKPDQKTSTNSASSMTIGEETMTNKLATLELTERLANQGVLIGHA